MSSIASLFSTPQQYIGGQGLNQFGGYSSAISGGIGGANQAMQGQNALVQALQRQAQGIGPSVAQEQLRQNNQRVSAQAAGAIAGQKGINPGLGGQLIARNQAAVQGANAGQASLERNAEQLGAQGQLGSALAQQGQTALGLAGLGSQGLGQNNQQLLGQQGIVAGQEQQQQQLGGQLLGSIVNGIATGGAMGIPGGGATGSGGGYSNPSIQQGIMAGGYAQGGMIDYRSGGQIPGHAMVAGDSQRNDTVPIMASPDEIMIPRSITQSPEAGELAKRFVQGILAHKQRMADGGQVEQPGIGTAIEQGLMSGYTRGANTNMAAFGDAAVPSISHAVNPEVLGQMAQDPELANRYRQALDYYQRRDGLAAQAHPDAYSRAETIGHFLPATLPIGLAGALYRYAQVPWATPPAPSGGRPQLNVPKQMQSQPPPAPDAQPPAPTYEYNDLGEWAPEEAPEQNEPLNANEFGRPLRVNPNARPPQVYQRPNIRPELNTRPLQEAAPRQAPAPAPQPAPAPRPAENFQPQQGPLDPEVPAPPGPARPLGRIKLQSAPKSKPSNPQIGDDDPEVLRKAIQDAMDAINKIDRAHGGLIQAKKSRRKGK